MQQDHFHAWVADDAVGARERARLCTTLLHADGEAKIVEVLRDAGLWDDPTVWRHYGDIENNWGQGGNQQSWAEAALAEKIVNSVDARLVNECRVHGIDPASAAAPVSVRAAIAKFFDHEDYKYATGGFLEHWGEQRVRRVAEGITLSATGVRPDELNITIADCGEGQTPNRLPETILSLNRSNKMYIPFVQGQFNQGGAGALRFCGNDNLQLVISRRNPLLVENEDPRDAEWCFTVVRRERPVDGRKNSVYTYLAPVGVGTASDERHGDVMSFIADRFGTFPNDDGPYERQATFGTAIKLYDYKFIGERSNILRGKSLLSRLDLMLPEIGLPVRLYEYRKDRRGSHLAIGSRRTTMSGLLRRIRSSPNVESGFPVSVPLQPRGERLMAHVFAFVPEGTTVSDGGEETGGTGRKLGGARSYRKREGILFLRNGQTQGTLPNDFFRRRAVKLKPIADDLLVFVDCDELTDHVREDLFMPSRDRLAEDDFKQSLVDSLEKMLVDCQELRELRNRRQKERMTGELRDDRPLADVLQSLIRKSPNLTALLQVGQRISAPFNTVSTGSKKKTRFVGLTYPTFFKYKTVDYGTLVKLARPVNQRIRLTFETDAQDDYFTRPADRGMFDLFWLGGKGVEIRASFTGPNLRNGIATVMLDLPEDAEAGQELDSVVRVRDRGNAIDEFEVDFRLVIQPKAKKRPSGEPTERHPPSDQPGTDRERPLRVAPPKITRVYRGDWARESFGPQTSMTVEHLGYSDDESSEHYEFKVNMDNLSLENESKEKRLAQDEYALLRQQFLYANVLIGLAMLMADKEQEEGSTSGSAIDGAEPVEQCIERTTRTLAPFMPAIMSLGGEDLTFADELEGLEDVG